MPNIWTMTLLKAAEKTKPLLVKLLPVTLLRNIKKNMINFEMERLAVERQSFLRESYPDGINLIGYIQGEIGLGQSCRLVAQALESSEIPYTIYNYNQVSAMRFNDNTWMHKVTNKTLYNINIIHINPYEMPLAFIRLGEEVWEKRYNIGFWLWELEDFPQEWENAFQLVDEIWTPSDFASKSIQKSTDKPVRIIPYALTTPDCGGYTRKDFALPDDIVLYLCMYDCNSTMERKNPLGAIKAYKEAFSKSNMKVGLVVKVNNPQHQDINRLAKELDGYPNTFILQDVMGKQQVNALIACVDVYISLHRAEGFGLVMAEAMLLGTPVIATNWSSNTEFMDNDVAMMVDYDFEILASDCGPYKKGNRWAAPNIGQASDYIKMLVDENLRKELALKAKKYIQEKFSPQKSAEMVKARMSEILGENK